MRLIDADALKEDILGLRDCPNGFSDTYDKACIIDFIDEQPTVEPDWNEIVICDSCGYAMRVKNGQPMYNYCPCCGFDMR